MIKTRTSAHRMEDEFLNTCDQPAPPQILQRSWNSPEICTPVPEQWGHLCEGCATNTLPCPLHTRQISPYGPYLPLPSHHAQISGAYCITGITIFTTSTDCVWLLAMIIPEVSSRYLHCTLLGLVLSEDGYP